MSAFDPSRFPVSRIGQGTWEMEHDRDPVRALKRGIELGMTHIDTAEMYGSGAVEALVGEAVRGWRDRIFLVSKVLPYNASATGTLAACERSLRALGTDYLDCYLLHWPGSEPIEETVSAFERLREQGKILSYGVSNFDVPDLEAFAAVSGAGNIACNQILYHPGERTVENRVIDWCLERGIAVVAYSPFGHGPLPGPGTAVGDALAEIANVREVSPHQAALAFVTRRPGLVAIPKASRLAHVEDNAKALSWSLAAEEIAALERALPTNPRARGIPML